jgi:hypothetical protein
MKLLFVSLRCNVRLACLATLLNALTLGQSAPTPPSDPAKDLALLLRFQPKFLIAKDDCAVAPSAFDDQSSKPLSTAADGTLYGHVKRVTNGTQLQYFHLWSKDCGRNGHQLDAEHVSILLDEAEVPRFALSAAHQNTVCDASQAVPLQTEAPLPTFWISRGKHASFLGPDHCRWGCGVDSCDAMQPLAVKRLVLLQHQPWIHSSQWQLRSKMDANDFPDELIARLQNASKPIAAHPMLHPTKDIVLAGDAAINGMETGAQHTDHAVRIGLRKTKRFLGQIKKKVASVIK